MADRNFSLTVCFPPTFLPPPPTLSVSLSHTLCGLVRYNPGDNTACHIFALSRTRAWNGDKQGKQQFLLTINDGDTQNGPLSCLQHIINLSPLAGNSKLNTSSSGRVLAVGVTKSLLCVMGTSMTPGPAHRIFVFAGSVLSLTPG